MFEDIEEFSDDYSESDESFVRQNSNEDIDNNNRLSKKSVIF